jgi:replicative DNA helicase
VSDQASIRPGDLHVVDDCDSDQVETSASSGVREWPEPIDFRNPPLPEFPIDALPDCMRDAAVGVSASMGNPCDMAAQVTIAFLSFAVSRLVPVEIKPGHVETTNLQLGIVAPPGGGKTPTLRSLESPVRTWQKEAREVATPRIVAAQAVYDAKASEIEDALKKASKVTDETEREIARQAAAEMKGQLALEIRPEVPRWITGDFSMPGLAMQMPAAGGRMISINDEGTILFNALLGKHSSNGSSEIGFFANLYNGGGHDESRAGREGVNLEEARLSVILTIQPEILKNLRGVRDLNDQGVLDRFAWSLADVPIAPADSPEIPRSAMQQYEDTLVRLLNLEPFDPARSSHTQEGLRLDPQARIVRTDWIDGLIRRVHDGELESYRGPIAKLRANVERLAGVLHMAKYPNTQAYTVNISPQTMEAATRVGDYWLGHIIGLHTMLGAAPGVSIAERIIRWIERQISKGRMDDGIFTRRDLYQTLKRTGGAIQKVGDLGDGLSMLEEHSFLLSTAGAASAKYEINPRAFGRGD